MKFEARRQRKRDSEEDREVTKQQIQIKEKTSSNVYIFFCTLSSPPTQPTLFLRRNTSSTAVHRGRGLLAGYDIAIHFGLALQSFLTASARGLTRAN